MKKLYKLYVRVVNFAATSVLLGWICFVLGGISTESPLLSFVFQAIARNLP